MKSPQQARKEQFGGHRKAGNFTIPHYWIKGNAAKDLKKYALCRLRFRFLDIKGSGNG
ncbi:hypothetical protein AGMMS49546_33620 [Spirochaetia bacterium]|nr:hypothetical protein AGMMS49546_33620 [Spirochaetia bacterium]